jgi:hypothetical protein
MNLYRKSRRLIFFIQQHYLYFISFIIITILILIFHQEIIYHIYIQTLDLKPYQNAITIWSTDFHIRYINNIEKFIDKILLLF